MNYLDSKYLKFLDYFTTHKEITNISRTSEVLNISRRMIYYYLDKLNEFLKSNNLGIVNKTNVGTYTLTTKQIEGIGNKLKNKQNDQYVFNSKERVGLIILSILLENRKVYVKDFSDWFSVSKNTIISDLKIVRKFLNDFDILLISKKQKGYFCEINEMLRRNLILKCLYELDRSSDKHIMSELFTFIADSSLYNEYLVIYDECLKALKRTEDILKKEISYSNRVLLSKAISLTSIFRQSHNGIISEKQMKLLQERVEYKAACLLINEIKRFMPCNSQECSYFAVLLLCVDKDTDFHFDSPTFKDILKISKLFIDNFERVSSVYINDESEFLKQIQTQMKVIYYRQLFNQVNLTDSLMMNDKQLIILNSIVKNVFETMWLDGGLEGIFKKRISDLDCYELALKIQSLILEEQLKTAEISALLVTDDSYTNSTILKSKIMRVVPNINISKCVSVDESLDSTRRFDLCLTTIETYRHPTIKTIFVHKNLETNDYLELLKVKHLQNKVQIKNEVENIITSTSLTTEEKVGKIDDLYQLKLIDSSYFKVTSLSNACSSNSKFYFPNQISLDKSLMYVRGSVKKEGILKDEEITNINVSDSNFKKYAFIFENVLLIHVNESKKELESHVILCGYKYPCCLNFDGKNREVKYIVVMVSDIYMSHLNILLELEEMIKNNQLMNFIRCNDTKHTD
ncbi:BglG family transcription antiterminator [Staphylococcus simulans]|uniref:BglG family transcription antiterminator n=1 Tax=Staphylococcus simulans TaxID=1286 RepID=UPI000D04271A|nr:helix-turn-helix domain-containing protein [Staphylococcus simulans]UXR34382.1 helix-turn-helix domain-containing protein [Staphylococcus simulans]